MRELRARVRLRFSRVLREEARLLDGEVRRVGEGVGVGRRREHAVGRAEPPVARRLAQRGLGRVLDELVGRRQRAVLDARGLERALEGRAA